MEKAAQRLIQQNLLESRYFAYELNLGYVSVINRKGNQLAFAQENRVFLYDLVGRGVLWNCEIPFQKNQSVFQLRLFDKDKIKVFTVDSHIPSHLKQLSIIVLSAGKIMNEIQFESNYFSKPSYNFITHKMQLFCLRKEFVQVIDLKNGETSSIPLEGIKGNQRATSHLNRNFYVFTTTNNPDKKRPSKVFVFDRITKQNKTFEFGLAYASMNISSSYIHKNHLFCGMSNLAQTQSPYLVVINLVTGEMEGRIAPDQGVGKIQHCIANDHWIVYGVKSNPHALWCVNRHTNEQKRVLSYPKTVYDAMHLSISENLLNLSSTTDWLQNFQVINLLSTETLVQVSFQHQITDHLQFEKGKLVIYNAYNQNRPTFYIEDYENPDGDFVAMTPRRAFYP